MALLLTGAIQLGMIYALMAMGVYVTFRILNVADLTVEGSFTLGVAVSAVVAAKGHPILALVAAILTGAVAGLVTGILHTKVKIQTILAGILTMTALYTINLAIMGGRANISLFASETVLSLIEKVTKLSVGTVRSIVTIGVTLLVFAFLSAFFKTNFGLKIRATGDNEEMVRASSINASVTKCAGLMLGNACVALSGAMLSQYQKSADVNIGAGMVVVGLASVIIGEAIIGKRSVILGIFSVIVGSVAYQIIIAIALKVNLLPAYGLKLISALIVAISLALPVARAEIKKVRRSKNV